MQKPVNFKLILFVLTGLLLELLLVGSVPARAEPALPLLNYLNQSPFEQKRNRQLCFAYEDQTPGLPCTAAHLGIKRPEKFWAYLHGNNNLSYFEDVADIVNGPVKADLLLPIIDHNSNENFQLGGSFGYVTENWGISFTPARLNLFTHIRNPSLPRISLLAAREEELQLQTGSFLNHEWSWGLQFRGIHRRFSYNDSYLSDHFTEDMDTLYKIKSQTAYFLEPSLLYAPEDVEWKPLFSLAISGLGQADEKLDPYTFDPSLHLGAAISDDLETGHLLLGAHGQWLQQLGLNKFYAGVGANYRLAEFEIFSTLSELEQQLGVGFNSQYFTTSIAYAEQDWNYNSTSKNRGLWRWDLGFRF